MAWWGSSTAGPRTRREMRAAYSYLSEDLVALSGELGRVRLDNIRLQAMGDALAAEIGRVRAELTNARTEVVSLQREAATMRPLLGDLMAESRDQRETLADNQRTITALTARLTDLLEAHLELANRPAPPTVITPAHATVVTGDALAPRPVADLRKAEQPAAAAAGNGAAAAPAAAATGSAERLRLIRHTLD